MLGIIQNLNKISINFAAAIELALAQNKTASKLIYKFHSGQNKISFGQNI